MVLPGPLQGPVGIQQDCGDTLGIVIVRMRSTVLPAHGIAVPSGGSHGSWLAKAQLRWPASHCRARWDRQQGCSPGMVAVPSMI